MTTTIILIACELVVGGAGYVGMLILRARLRSALASLGHADAALERQRTLLATTTTLLEETQATLAATQAKYNEAHRDRQLLLEEAGAHRAVEMAVTIPGLTDEERRAVRERLAAAKAASPKARIR